jgi:hypothetical protein
MRLRPLTEAECYARCYGTRHEHEVRRVNLEPPRFDLRVDGEQLRRRFEERLEARDREAA